MPLPLLQEAMAKLEGTRFRQGYGMTETSPLLTVLQYEDHFGDAVTSATLRSVYPISLRTVRTTIAELDQVMWMHAAAALVERIRGRRVDAVPERAQGGGAAATLQVLQQRREEGLKRRGRARRRTARACAPQIADQLLERRIECRQGVR